MPDSITISAKPSQLAAAYLRTAHTHATEVERTVTSLRYQLDALKIASNTLDLHVLAISDAFESVSLNAQPEINKQATLLNGISTDLDIIAQVEVHREFLSTVLKIAIDAGEKPRTLGNYVNRDKMVEVGKNCRRVHGKQAHTRFSMLFIASIPFTDSMTDLFGGATTTMHKLTEGADMVRATVLNDELVDVSASRSLANQVIAVY